MRHPIFCSISKRQRRAAYTVVEVLIAATLMLLVTGAVFSVVLMAGKSMRKTQMLDEAAQASRVFHEHLTREINSAIKKDALAGLGLQFGIGEGAGSARFAQLVYRVPVCDPVEVVKSAKRDADSLELMFPRGAKPAVGDYVVVPVPNTRDRLRIASPPSDPDPSGETDRVVKVQLNMTIAAATVGALQDVEENTTYVSVYRERKYEVDDPKTDPVTAVRWWENTSDNSEVKTLVAKVPAGSRYMFERIPNDPKQSEYAVGWRFAYQGGSAVSGSAEDRRDFWENNKVEGVLWARSGDPQNPSAHPETTMEPSTSKTTVASTKRTTSVGPSTTRVSTSRASTSIGTTKPPTTRASTKPSTTVLRDG